MVLLVSQPAWASGPGVGGRELQLSDEPAGPYTVRVFTSPTPPTVGDLYLEIRVQEAKTDKVLVDAQVTTRADPVGFEAESLEAEATHDIAPFPIDFASHLPVSAPGEWRITIAIDGSEGPASIAFPVLVERATSSVLPIVAATAAGVLILVAGSVLLRRQRMSE